MPQEIVTLKVNLDAPSSIETRLKNLDALVEHLQKNGNIKISLDASDLNGLSAEAQRYIHDTSSKINQAIADLTRTPLQKQIDALTGVSREFKSAAESAKVFIEVQKKVGDSTGNFIDPKVGTAGFQEFIKNVEGLGKASVTATRNVGAADSVFQQFSVSVRNSNGDFENYTYSVNALTGEVHKMSKGISTAKVETEQALQSQKRFSSELKKTEQAAESTGNSFRTVFSNMLISYAANALLTAPIQALSMAVDELKAVDAELVNIQKVMGATAGEMEKLSAKAYEVGSALGVSASEYLASVTKWAQAGYGSLSDELGELSVKTQLVGDVQEETANQFLLSVDAAYQYKGNIESLTRVLDGANEISNNYATSVEKLAGGMGIVSSLAAQAGMEVQETMAAIGTITAVTQESGNSAARALRALILNIQGSTEIAIDEASGERWTEDEIEATAAALGDLNIATREYKDGVEQLRNPMDVIGELSEKYRQGLISEVQLQEVVSSLGGKVRSNQLQALISNYDLYLDQLQTYEESVGSANRELDIYLASWEAKTKRLQNQWVELVDSFKVSELSMGLLDIGNALLEIANTDLEPVAKWASAIGSLGDGKTSTGIEEMADAITESAAAVGKLVVQIVAVTASLVALKAVTSGLGETNFGKGAKGFLGDLLSGLKGVPKAASDAKGSLTGLSGALSGLKGGVAQLGSTLVSSFGLVPLAIAAITAEIIIGKKVIDNFIANDRYNKKLQEFADEYNIITAEVEALNSELETTQDRIDELNKKDTLTLTEQAELDRLKTMNSLLETQIELKKEAQREAANDVINAANDAINKGGFSGDQSAINGSTFANMGALGFTALNPGSILLALGGRYIFDKTYLRDWDSQIKKLDEEMETAIKENNLERVETLKELQADMLEQLNEELQSLDLEEMEAGDPEKLKELLNSYQDLQFRITAISDPLGAVATRLKQFEDSLSPEKLDEYSKRLEELGADGKVTANEVKELAETFPFLNDLVDSGAVTWDELAQHFTSVANEAVAASGSLDTLGDSANESTEDAENLSETLDGLTSNLKLLSEAQNELANNGELSYETVLSLMEKVPELEAVLTEYLAGVASEAELQEALGQAYSDNADAYQQSILEKMYDNQEFYKNIILTNTDIVAKLADLGITDLENYESIADLKTAVSERFNTASQISAEETTAQNTKSYNAEAKAYIESRKTMAKAMKSIIPGASLLESQLKPERATLETDATAVVDDILSQLDSILNDVIEIPDLDLNLDTDPGGGSAAEKAEDYYQTQIQAMDDLVAYARDTNTLLEKEDKNSLEKRAQNLTDVLSKINQTANDFRDRGLADESEQVQELKLLWHEVYEERQAIYESLYDDLTDTLADQEWNLDLFQKNRENADRSVEEIAEDCQKIVSEYKSMQEEVADLAAYYRSMGYDETDDLIQDLSDKWWEYQDNIESVYDALTDAFQDYIDESDRQLKQLERTMGSTGQQIELLYQRIATGREYLAALQATNVNGINDDNIAAIQDQIWGDEDRVSDLVDGLWDELGTAVDKEFDKWQDKINEAQDKLDDFNQKVADLDEELQEIIDPLQEQIEDWEKELEDALDDPAWEFFNESLRNSGMSINEAIEKYTDAIEAEQEALEKATDPLRKKIEGYYIVNPDGTIGGYVPGIEDERDKWQDLLDAENERWQKEQEQHEEDQALARKQLALAEAIKNLEQAQLDLETARNERTVYTLKDGVWAWRPDDQAIQEAEEALEDAEQAKDEAKDELDWLELEQAHDKLADFYEKQAKLEQDKIDDLNKQIDALERESEARQDYLNDQLDLWEDEKEAWEDHYNGLIERNEDEIEAWEEYYEKRKEYYDEDIEFWTTEVKNLQEQYDAFAERWEDIQDSMTDDVRSIEEILADIAKYGTPEMKAQIDNITDLLRDMGVALGDFNSSIGDNGWGSGGNTSGGSSGSSYQDIIDQMKENALSWWEAKNNHNDSLADYYYQQNQILGAQIPGATFNPDNGVWYDSNGNPLYTLPSSGGSSGDFSSGGSSSSGRPSSDGSSSGGMSMVEVSNRIDELKLQAGTGSMTTKKAAFEEANRLAVSKGALPIEYSPFPNDWYWYDAEGNWLFDKGGVAHGRGVMVKDVEAPELVLSPVLAADVLNPVKNTEFDRFAKDLGIMFGAAQNYAPDTRMERQPVVHNVDSHNVGAIINGVELGENMLDRPLSEILSLLGIHRDY